MRPIIITILLATLLLLQDCTGDRSKPVQKNALIPGRVVVFSESVFRTPGAAQTDNMPRLDAYNKSVIRKALANELAIHQVILSHRDLAETKELSPENLQESLDLNKSQFQGNTDSIIAACVGEITSGLFVEEWFLDEDRFLLRKKVIAYQPVRHAPRFFEDPGSLMSQPTGDTAMILLFSVFTDPPEEPAHVMNMPDGLKLLAENIQYEVELFNRPYYEYLYTDENEISETEVEKWANYNFNFYKYFDREKFIDIILDKVISGSVKAFDPSDQKKVLKLHDIYATLQADSILEPIRDTLTGEIDMQLIEVYLPRGDINSLIFIEDWYYNEKTMGIIKIVKGVIPVLHQTIFDRYSYPAGTERIPVFLVWFNNG